MYTIWDSVNQELVEVFNDYESAQMFLIHMSDLLPDGGEELTIKEISTVQDWAASNGVELDRVF